MPGYAGPDLSQLLSKLKNKPQTDPVFPRTSRRSRARRPAARRLRVGEAQEFDLTRPAPWSGSAAAATARRAPSFDLTDIEAIDPGNDPDKAFNDRSFFGTGCRDQIHGVAKAAIRAALARIVADTAGNPLILQIDPSGQNDLGAYRRTGCFDVGEPPFDLATTNTRPCRGEEYIATVALKAARAGLQARPGVPLFNPGQLQSVFRFWCAKVDCDVNASAPIVQSDEQADAFIREAIAFIAFVQQETVGVYKDTLAFDRKTIGALPYLDIGPPPDPGDAQTPGVGQICTGALANSDLTGQMLPGVFLPQPLTGVDEQKVFAALQSHHRRSQDERRSDCDRVAGHTRTVPAGREESEGHQEAARCEELRAQGSESAGAEHGRPDGERQSRAVRRQRRRSPDLPRSEDRSAAARARCAKRNLGRTEAGQPGREAAAVSGALWSWLARYASCVRLRDRSGARRSGSNRTDNQASLFYYVLDPSSNAVPSTADAPVDAVDTSPDPLAIPQPDLAFTLRVRSAGGGTPYRRERRDRRRLRHRSTEVPR